MTDRLLLLGRNNRQAGQAVASVLGKLSAAKFLELSPAWPRRIGVRPGDLAQQAFPFNEKPVNVAAMDVLVESLHRDEIFGAEGADNLGAARAVVDRHAVDKKAVAGEAAVGFLAGEGKT